MRTDILPATTKAYMHLLTARGFEADDIREEIEEQGLTDFGDGLSQGSDIGSVRPDGGAEGGYILTDINQGITIHKIIEREL